MVRLFDVARGLPQRIEGQYRRNWSFAPALWNLYFRERINLGASLVVKDTVQVGHVTKVQDTDMAEAAVGLYKKLDAGILDIGLSKRLLHYKLTRGSPGFSRFQVSRKLGKTAMQE